MNVGPVSPENSDNDANDLAQEEGEDEYSENDYEQVMKEMRALFAASHPFLCYSGRVF